MIKLVSLASPEDLKDAADCRGSTVRHAVKLAIIDLYRLFMSVRRAKIGLALNAHINAHQATRYVTLKMPRGQIACTDGLRSHGAFIAKLNKISSNDVLI